MNSTKYSFGKKQINYIENRTYLYVPFGNKDEAKKYGCKFDFEKKEWYCLTNNPKYELLIKIFCRNNFKQSFKDDSIDKIEPEHIEKPKPKHSLSYFINIGNACPLYEHPLFNEMTEQEQDDYNNYLSNYKFSKYI